MLFDDERNFSFELVQLKISIMELHHKFLQSHFQNSVGSIYKLISFHINREVKKKKMKN